MLQEIDAGAAIAAVARALGIAGQIITRWRDKYAGMQARELKALRAVQAENVRLKQIVAMQAA